MEPLQNTVRHYDWGDPSFIAQLQGRAPSGQPEAELWIGAHPGAPSRLASTGQTLDTHITAHPETTLGGPVRDAFGQLPYLAKILAAAKPLSLQTHPSMAQAAEGYQRENNAGVELHSRERIYSDPNHKPELICALTPFEAKSGFAPLALTRQLLVEADHPGLADLKRRLDGGGVDADVLRDVLGWMLSLGRSDQQALVDAAVAVGESMHESRFADAWSWVPRLAQWYPGDVGAVVSLLLNHVVLAPGDAMFLPAGNLHSYLGGCGVEVMANSDNVVRCGLTSKHVDVGELLRIVDTTPLDVDVQTPTGPRHRYRTTIREFTLERFRLSASFGNEQQVKVDGPEILVATAGEVVAHEADGTVHAIAPGQALWVEATEQAYSLAGDGEVFRVSVNL